MRKGQKQTEETKEKIRKARLKRTEEGYSDWNAKISEGMKNYWLRRHWEEKKELI